MQRSIPEVLREECDAVVGVASGLPEQDFSIPTVCRPWDIKALLAHMWRDLFRIPDVLKKPEPPEANVDAIAYWTSYDPSAEAPRIAQHALETAHEYDSGTELAKSFHRLSSTCYELASNHPPDRLIEVWWGPRMRLEEFLKTRVLEIVVHGIDMTDALAMAPVATGDGMSVTTSILDGLLGHGPPAELGWSDINFIRKGTGRERLTETEARVLRAFAPRFPLLG